MSIQHLYSCFCQIDSECQLFSHEYIRIVSLLEGSLQRFQLHAGERRSVAALLLFTCRHDAGIVRVRRRLVRVRRRLVRVMTSGVVTQSRSWRRKRVVHSQRHRRRSRGGHQRRSLFCRSKPREAQHELTDKCKRNC